MIDLIGLNTFLLVERCKMETLEYIRASLIPGEWVSSINLSDTYLHIPIHQNSRKYLGVPRKVLPQFTGVPVDVPPFWPSHSPTGLYNDCKGSEADGPHKGSQASSIPGRLGHQDSVSEGSTSKDSDRSRPDTVLRVNNKAGEV